MGCAFGGAPRCSWPTALPSPAPPVIPIWPCAAILYDTFGPPPPFFPPFPFPSVISSSFSFPQPVVERVNPLAPLQPREEEEEASRRTGYGHCCRGVGGRGYRFAVERPAKRAAKYVKEQKVRLRRDIISPWIFHDWTTPLSPSSPLLRHFLACIGDLHRNYYLVA